MVSEQLGDRAVGVSDVRVLRVLGASFLVLFGATGGAVAAGNGVESAVPSDSVQAKTEASRGRYQGMPQRVLALEVALNLRADQKASWEAFKAAALDRRWQTEQRRGERPKTAIEAMKVQEERVRNQLSSLEKSRKMAEALYSKLDAAQKGVFDEGMQPQRSAPRGGRGERERGNRGMPPAPMAPATR